MPRIRRTRIIYATGPRIQEGDEVPDIEFENPDPPIEACDQVLGYYLRIWGYVEDALGDLLTILLGAHVTASRVIITSPIGQQTLREITGALGTHRLSKKDADTLGRLLRRVRNATTLRNRVVHGTWRVVITLGRGDTPNTAKWERFYEPSDLSAHEQMNAPRPNQKVVAKYRFSIERILQLAAEANALAMDIRRFSGALSVADFADMRPVKFSRR
jgi:hypothetical protein